MADARTCSLLIHMGTNETGQSSSAPIYEDNVVCTSLTDVESAVATCCFAHLTAETPGTAQVKAKLFPDENSEPFPETANGLKLQLFYFPMHNVNEYHKRVVSELNQEGLETALDVWENQYLPIYARFLGPEPKTPPAPRGAHHKRKRTAEFRPPIPGEEGAVFTYYPVFHGQGSEVNTVTALSGPGDAAGGTLVQIGEPFMFPLNCDGGCVRFACPTACAYFRVFVSEDNYRVKLSEKVLQVYMDEGIPVQLPADQNASTKFTLWVKPDPYLGKNSFARVRSGASLAPSAEHSVKGTKGRWTFNAVKNTFELHAALPAVDADQIHVHLFGPVGVTASPLGEVSVHLSKRPTLAQWNKAQAKKVRQMVGGLSPTFVDFFSVIRFRLIVSRPTWRRLSLSSLCTAGKKATWTTGGIRF